MAEAKKYPYTTVPNNLRKLLAQIPTLGAPPKATLKWLAGIGFTGGNNRSLLPVLRHIGVIDQTGTPTPVWTALRAGDKVKFAEAVRKGYVELFSTYPDADKQDNATLQTFFRTHTGLGDKAQSLLARTFKVLCEYGDFSKSQEVSGAASGSDKIKGTRGEGGGGSKAGDGHDGKSSGSGGASDPSPAPLALTVNLQIELPPSADGDVYDKLFAAMGKHLKGLITPAK